MPCQKKAKYGKAPPDNDEYMNVLQGGCSYSDAWTANYIATLTDCDIVDLRLSAMWALRAFAAGWQQIPSIPERG